MLAPNTEPLFYGFRVQSSKVQGSAPPLVWKAASLIEKETLKKRISNNEYRMSNIEVRYSVYFKKDRAQRSYPSKFCGSLFQPCEVSY